MTDPTMMLLLLQPGSTLAMTGLVWFVQISHYPLFSAVGNECIAVRTTAWTARLLLLGAEGREFS